MNNDLQNTIKLYELLKKGQLTSGNNHNDPNYERYSYTISDDFSIKITFETADLDTFNGNEEEKNAKLKNMQSDLIEALAYHSLHANPPTPNYVVLPPHTIQITQSGLSILKAMRATLNGPKGPINTDSLKKAIATPDKIINLSYGPKEIKIKIIKEIIENRDEHFTFVGNDSGVNSYVCAKQEYAFLSSELLTSFERCISSLHPSPGHQATQLITETITIELFNQLFENPELTTIKQTVLSNKILQTKLQQLKQILDSKGFDEDDDYIFADNCFQLYPEGMEKLRKLAMDYRLQHLCDQSTQKTTTPTKSTLVRTILSTQKNGGSATYLNCSNTNEGLLHSLIRFYRLNQMTDKPPYIFTLSNYHKNVQDVIYLGQSSYTNVYSSIHPRSTGLEAALTKVRLERELTASHIQLASELTTIFTSIKTHSDKIEHFKENGSIVNIFKKTRDIAIMDRLFIQLLEAKSKIDIGLNWADPTNTHSWIKLIGYIQSYATGIVQSLCQPLSYKDTLDLKIICGESKLFTYHPQNNPFEWLFNTDAMSTIVALVVAKAPKQEDSDSESSNSDDDAEEELANNKRDESPNSALTHPEPGVSSVTDSALNLNRR